MTWTIVLTPTARAMLAVIRDRRVRDGIRRRVDDLAEDPEKQGKALLGQLAGYRSVGAVGERYRIIYRLEANKVLVIVVAMGIRRQGDKAEIYALAQKLLRLRLLDPPPD